MLDYYNTITLSLETNFAWLAPQEYRDLAPLDFVEEHLVGPQGNRKDGGILTSISRMPWLSVEVPHGI